MDETLSAKNLIVSFRSEAIIIQNGFVFSFKYKNLLIAGKSANLTMRAEAGKSTITLAVQVEDLSPRNQARDGPSREEEERGELQLAVKRLK